MHFAPKVAAVAAVVLALGGTGAGTALAAAHSNAPHASVATAGPTSPDNDGLQQGDQTSPDNASVQTAADTGTPEPGESPAGNEQAAPDGPGGHADPSGTVQHEFSGTE